MNLWTLFGNKNIVRNSKQNLKMWTLLNLRTLFFLQNKNIFWENLQKIFFPYFKKYLKSDFFLKIWRNLRNEKNRISNIFWKGKINLKIKEKKRKKKQTPKQKWDDSLRGAPVRSPDYLPRNFLQSQAIWGYKSLVH